MEGLEEVAAPAVEARRPSATKLPQGDGGSEDSAIGDDAPAAAGPCISPRLGVEDIVL